MLRNERKPNNFDEQFSSVEFFITIFQCRTAHNKYQKKNENIIQWADLVTKLRLIEDENAQKKERTKCAKTLNVNSIFWERRKVGEERKTMKIGGDNENEWHEKSMNRNGSKKRQEWEGIVYQFETKRQNVWEQRGQSDSCAIHQIFKNRFSTFFSFLFALICINFTMSP